MRDYILISIVCLLTACATSPGSVEQRGTDGKNRDIEGYGFTIKDGVALYKNFVVNNAIEGTVHIRP